MPQMAPIMWSYLFIFFNTTTLILATKIFFQTKTTLTNNVISISTQNKKYWKL